MAQTYPVEVWPGDAEVSRLDGVTDEATGLPYIAKGTGPTSDPPLEIQYNRGQQRLKRMLWPWNQGRVVEEVGGLLGVFPIQYWMDGLMQSFEGATGLSLPGIGAWMVYIDADGVLQMATDWPAATTSFLPLAEVTFGDGQLAIRDARPYAAFRAGRDAALWPFALAPRITIGAEAGNAIDVTVQVVDAAGNSATGQFCVHVWLSDTTDGALASATPDGGTLVTAGLLLATESSGKRWRLLTANDGSLVLRITHSAARSWYPRAELGGRIVTGNAITFA